MTATKEKHDAIMVLISSQCLNHVNLSTIFSPFFGPDLFYMLTYIEIGVAFDVASILGMI